MSRAVLLVGRPVARAADGLVHNRDRRRRIRQFHRVARVTVRPSEANAPVTAGIQ
jgi:hypothetical protein